MKIFQEGQWHIFDRCLGETIHLANGQHSICFTYIYTLPADIIIQDVLIWPIYMANTFVGCIRDVCVLFWPNVLLLMPFLIVCFSHRDTNLQKRPSKLIQQSWARTRFTSTLWSLATYTLASLPPLAISSTNAVESTRERWRSSRRRPRRYAELLYLALFLCIHYLQYYKYSWYRWLNAISHV